MKKLLILTFLFTLLSANAQMEIEYHFYNQCKSSIIKDSITFEFENFETNESYFSEGSKVIIPSIGKYELSVTIRNGNFQRSYEEKIEFKETKAITDTLIIPRILFERNTNDKLDYSCYLNCGNYTQSQNGFAFLFKLAKNQNVLFDV